MEFTPHSDNETAGLVIERDRDYYLRFTIGMENGKRVLSLFQKNRAGMQDSLIARKPIDRSTGLLQITSQGFLYSFRYSNNGKQWSDLVTGVDGRLLGLAGAGRFTGTFVGMYASSNGLASKNYVDVDWFEYGENKTK